MIKQTLTIAVLIGTPLFLANLALRQNQMQAFKQDLRNELVASINQPVCDYDCQQHNKACQENFGIPWGDTCKQKNRDIGNLIFTAKKANLDEAFQRNSDLRYAVAKRGGVWTDADKAQKAANDALKDAPVIVTYEGQRFKG